jgi:hypothetical protein
VMGPFSLPCLVRRPPRGLEASEGVVWSALEGGWPAVPRATQALIDQVPAVATAVGSNVLRRD